MRRSNSVEVVVEGPDKGLITAVPSDMPDKNRNRAIVAGENVRAEFGVLRNAPGYERVVTSPAGLDTPANLIFQANILNGDPELRDTPIIGTSSKLYTMRRRAKALSCLAGSGGNACDLTAWFLGDSGKIDTPLEDVSGMIKDDRPDLIVHVGDMVYDDAAASSALTLYEQHVAQYFYEYLGNYNGVYGVGPRENKFMPTVGNHEWDDGGIANYLDFFQIAKNPNERYFQYKRGPIHFVHLSGYESEEEDGVAEDSVQGAWATSVIAASTSPWIIVVVHFPPYTSEATKYPGQSSLRWLFNHNISAVVCGHAHVSEVVQVNSIYQFVTGVGGRSLRTFNAPPVAGSLWRDAADYGALKLDANFSRLLWRFYQRDGTLLHTVEMENPLTDGGTCYIGDAAKQVFTLEVVPANAGVEVGYRWPFEAYAHYEDGTVEDVTLQAVWTSADESIATIGSTSGEATGISPGTVEITAEFKDESGTANLTVFHSCLDDPSDVVFVVERSESMLSSADGASRLQHVKDGIAMARETFRSAEDKLGLVSFAGTYADQTEDAATDQVLTDQYASFDEAVASLSASGTGTSVAEALAEAQSILAPSTATNKVAVLIVDGPANVTAPGGDTSTEAAAIAAATSAASTQAQLLRDAGVTVVVIGYAVQDEYVADLTALASPGYTWFPNNAAELKTALALLSNTFCIRNGYYYSYSPTSVYSTELNYSSFTNWDVTRGAVDLVGKGSNGLPLYDVLPGNGMYVDMVGTDPISRAGVAESPDGTYEGKMESKTTFNFVVGKTYKLSFYLAGNNVNRDGDFGVDVSISGGVLAADSIVISDKLQPFTLHEYEFTVASPLSGKIIFDSHDNPGANVGLLLDRVTLENVTDSVTMFTDTFDTENPK